MHPVSSADNVRIVVIDRRSRRRILELALISIVYDNLAPRDRSADSTVLRERPDLQFSNTGGSRGGTRQAPAGERDCGGGLEEHDGPDVVVSLFIEREQVRCAATRKDERGHTQV